MYIIVESLISVEICVCTCPANIYTAMCTSNLAHYNTVLSVIVDAEQLAAPLVDTKLPNDESLALSGAADDISHGNTGAPPSGNQANTNPLQGGQADLPPSVSPTSGALADGNPSLEPPSGYSCSILQVVVAVVVVVVVVVVYCQCHC